MYKNIFLNYFVILSICGIIILSRLLSSSSLRGLITFCLSRWGGTLILKIGIVMLRRGVVPVNHKVRIVRVYLLLRKVVWQAT